MKVFDDIDFNLYCDCAMKARQIVDSGLSMEIGEEDLTDLIFKMEKEKLEKNEKSDSLLAYDDEIVYIEEVGDKETIDISVSGDNLFYCNGILTKNSFGLPATADLMFAIVSNEQLAELGQYMVKQLKNRYNDVNTNKRFVIGVDKSKMRLYNLESSAQNGIVGGSVTPTPDFRKGGSTDRYGDLIV